jgi:hypothetical protein
MIKIACKHAVEYKNLVFVLDYEENNLYIGSTDFVDIQSNFALQLAGDVIHYINYSKILSVKKIAPVDIRRSGDFLDTEEYLDKIPTELCDIIFEVTNPSAVIYPKRCCRVKIPKNLQMISPLKNPRYKYIHKSGYFHKMYTDSLESLAYLADKNPYCLWILYIRLEQVDIIRYIFQIIGELINMDFDLYKEIHYQPEESECFNSDYF